jgi:hypothetical protein
LTKQKRISYKKKEACMNHTVPILLLFMASHGINAHANPKGALIPTDQVVTLRTIPIYNQADVLKDITDFVQIPVLFPTIIKAETGKIYFAYTNLQENFKSSSPKAKYDITIGYTPGCFATYCTLGSVSAELKGQMTPDYTLKHDGDKTTEVEVQKVSVTLANNIKGYYTPGFTAAGYVEPKIQWTYKDVLYTIQWAGTDQKELVQMANSAIMAELSHHK